jgi:hypothetical protein
VPQIYADDGLLVHSHQAARARSRVRLDQLADLVIHAAHDAVHVAKLALHQTKTCGKIFNLGRHGKPTPSAKRRVEVVG